MDATDEGGRQRISLTMESPGYTQMVTGKGVRYTSRTRGLPNYRERKRTIEEHIVHARVHM